jgi:hypothetical protein
MNVYRLTEIILDRPVTIVARDDVHAANLVTAAFSGGFGRMVSVNYTIAEYDPAWSAERDVQAALMLTESGEPGFVQEHESFWDTHDPYRVL